MFDDITAERCPEHDEAARSNRFLGRGRRRRRAGQSRRSARQKGPAEAADEADRREAAVRDGARTRLDLPRFFFFSFQHSRRFESPRHRPAQRLLRSSKSISASRSTDQENRRRPVAANPMRRSRQRLRRHAAQSAKRSGLDEGGEGVTRAGSVAPPTRGTSTAASRRWRKAVEGARRSCGSEPSVVADRTL